MDIIEIFPDTLYSVQLDGADTPEYIRVFNSWNDLDGLVSFFIKNQAFIDTPFWRNAGLNPDTPELSAQRVVDEANKLEKYLLHVVKNTRKGESPDLDDYFKPLGGKYRDIWMLEPRKSYGTEKPSLLRLYALRLDRNIYLLVYGGIKLGPTIQTSPGLDENVIRQIDAVLDFLHKNGITDSNDI